MDLSPDLTNEFINSTIAGRITGLGGELECTALTAKRKVEGWRANGDYVVANAGAYDAFGLNHLRGLIQARIIGAAYKLGSTDDISAIYNLAVSDNLRLIVSLDTNEAISENKSFKTETGGSVRPLYDWDTRARMISMQSILPGGNLVDFITKHGPRACEVCVDDSCPHSEPTYSVASTGADLTIVKSLSDATKDQYKDSRFHVIEEANGAFFDKVLSSQISTTALVKRARMDRSYQ